ncbi:MAG: nucleotide exchange factor GrpE [Burkholderiales bacterium]
MTRLDDAQKQRLVEEFRACLEQWEQEGEDASEPVDLRTLLGEMAALKNEVRLESRQFKGALEELKSFGEALRAHNERLVRDLERAREQAAEAQRQVERRLLLGMLDLRDRLQAGADAAAARRPSVLARLVPGETRFALALSEGLTLTLQRLDELLVTHRVRPIDALGQPLDPQRMRAVGVEAVPEAPDGMVLREARRGFLLGGELLRAAEVIVNKKATQS